MDLRGSMTLGGRVARALARIASDRAREWGGVALPRTPEQIARPEVVNALLASQGDGAPPRVTRVSLPGVRFESSNCRNFLIEVEWEEATLRRGGPLPRSLYVKLPCEALATRAFANVTGFWAVECAFARRVARQVPIRVPRVFAVAEQGARFVLLLENLHEEPGTRLFTNRDMAAGTTVEQARLCLETFAELHASFWAADEQRRESLLPNALHTYLAPGGRALTRALAAAAIAPAHRAAPDLFDERHAALCRRAVSKWDALVDAWYAGPLTLVHGDSHLANCFEYRHEGTARMGMLDFQGMQWCHGLRDVQYFLINSLEPEVLAAHEEELVRGYVDALGRRGVALRVDEAWQRYRAYSFQTLMVAVVSLGLGSLTEREATLRTVLRRAIAAVERVRFEGWLART
jgi:aminoglycoside/choline kinase family phosphotransferase